VDRPHHPSRTISMSVSGGLPSLAFLSFQSPNTANKLRSVWCVGRSGVSSRPTAGNFVTCAVLLVVPETVYVSNARIHEL
jgi:hypothetical protein